ncbi:MAG: hypothetical protein HOO08_03390 [Opitutae bacterium]|nr:hypothetical protein [Opitutae bacterium]
MGVLNPTKRSPVSTDPSAAKTRMVNGGKRSVVSTEASAANPTHGNDGAFPSSDT